MHRHIATVTESEYNQLRSGTRSYLFKSFKKKPGFINDLYIGDIVFFKKEKGDVSGQFEVGKIIFIENLESGDWNLVKQIDNGLTKEKFQELILMNSFMVIIKINKLEQLITSPVEINKRSKKEWTVLEN